MLPHEDLVVVVVYVCVSSCHGEKTLLSQYGHSNYLKRRKKPGHQIGTGAKPGDQFGMGTVFW